MVEDDDGKPDLFLPAVGLEIWVGDRNHRNGCKVAAVSSRENKGEILALAREVQEGLLLRRQCSSFSKAIYHTRN